MPRFAESSHGIGAKVDRLKAHCRSPIPASMKTILTPVDFSSATDRVIGAAASLARSFDGRVVLLNVTQPPTAVGDDGSFVVDFAELTRQMAKSALAELERLQGKLETDFIAAEIIQLTGLPVTTIIEQAKKLPADYIVLGSHGHTAFYDLLVGSTANGVLKRATCPVVIVPAAKTKAPKSRKGDTATAGKR